MEESKEHLIPYQQTSFEQTDFDSLENGSDGSLDEDKAWAIIKKVKKSSRRLRFFIVILVIIVCSTGSVIFTRSRSQGGVSLYKPEWKHSSNTAAEAHANNCVLDFIPGAWVPRACYDAELEQEFLGLQQWRWYADEESKHELSFEYIKETGGPHPIFVSMEYHRQHCAYTWRKFHRAVIRNVPIDTHIGQFKHTDHCTKSLAAPDSPMRSKFGKIYSACKMAQDFTMDEGIL